MSSEKTVSIMSSATHAIVANDLGSVAALRLALQTLAERCEKLQSRLDVVEKENVTIKSCCTCQAVDDNTTQVNVKELTCKKQQLLEYLQIVTDENCTLWTKLSSLDNPAVCSSDKIRPKNSQAIVDNYLKFNGMSTYQQYDHYIFSVKVQYYNTYLIYSSLRVSIIGNSKNILLL